MSKLTTTVTAPLNEFITIANELGYQEFVPSLNTTTGATEVTPNPVDRRAFLQNYFKAITVNELAKVRLRAIEQAVLDERTAEKEAVRASLNNAVAVTFKA